ncbi:hypothetical protein D3C80_1347280 [compost metagenome]
MHIAYIDRIEPGIAHCIGRKLFAPPDRAGQQITTGTDHLGLSRRRGYGEIKRNHTITSASLWYGDTGIVRITHCSNRNGNTTPYIRQLQGTQAQTFCFLSRRIVMDDEISSILIPAGIVRTIDHLHQVPVQ